LRLVTKGALKNTPYYVSFALASGTNAAINFNFNGTVDNGITYNKLTKLGSISVHQAEPSGQYYVRIYAENFVSYQTFVDIFEVSGTIENAALKVLMNNNNQPQSIYLFSSNLSFVIDMTMGSNVKIVLYIGEEDARKTLPITRSVDGDWLNPLYINTRYMYPDDYNVTANVSNALSYVVLVQTIM
jgi:hypothetical protein